MTDLADVPVERHYSVGTVAKLFDVKTPTVRTWINDGKIRARKINGSWKIPESELKRLGESKYGIPGKDEKL